MGANEGSFAERAIDWLSENGYVDHSVHGFVATIDGHTIGVDFSPELLDDEAAHLREVGAEHWPSVDAELAAFRLLSVYLEEALATLRSDTRLVRFDGETFIKD